MMLENSFTSEDMKNFIQLVEKPSALGLYMLEAAKAVSVLEDSEKNSNCKNCFFVFPLKN